MKNQEDKLTIIPTKKPHTFFLQYKQYIFSQDKVYYKILAEQLVREVNKAGIKANLRKRYKFNAFYYITFKSKYDAAAFKLGWM